MTTNPKVFVLFLFFVGVLFALVFALVGFVLEGGWSWSWLVPALVGVAAMGGLVWWEERGERQE